MDQFSHDLTLALEETSLMDRACGVGRWGSRRRTRSTGNLPCAPQPTEDSSSPTDALNAHAVHATHTNANVDGLDTHNIKLPASDSDEKAEGMWPLCKSLNAAMRMGLGALESDSLNETNFSPARFYKPNSRRKRKIKRISMEFEFSKDSNFSMSAHSFIDSPLQPGMLCTGSNAAQCAHNTSTGTLRKRGLKSDSSGHRSNLFFCGKRKRSNRDRYHEHEHHASGSSKLHSSSMPRYTYTDDFTQRMRPRSYSSTSKPHSDRLMPLNKGLLSKINRIAQQQKTDNTEAAAKPTSTALDASVESGDINSSLSLETIVPINDSETLVTPNKLTQPLAQQQHHQAQQLPLEANYHVHRKKSHGPGGTSKSHRRRRYGNLTPTELPVQQSQSMDCSDLYDFLSSSSLSSSSDSEDGQRRHDTDREGDDELTDWPGNEFGPGGKYDPKRKLTKKSILPQIRSDDTIGEDDTLMSGTESSVPMVAATVPTVGASVNGVVDSQSPLLEPPLKDLPRFHAVASEPIDINAPRHMNSLIDVQVCLNMDSNMPPLRQIESEMSGETSNPFLSSSPVQVSEVREIRAGCRRINGDRPGFSIKLSVNERLARFLQDSRQTQIRLPDIEIYERDSLFNLATLYSLTMVVEHGCTVLTKTRNTTQSVNMDQHRGLQQRTVLFSDLKRRCYDGDGASASLLPPK